MLIKHMRTILAILMSAVIAAGCASPAPAASSGESGTAAAGEEAETVGANDSSDSNKNAEAVSSDGTEDDSQKSSGDNEAAEQAGMAESSEAPEKTVLTQSPTPYEKYGRLQICHLPADNTAGYTAALCDESGNPVQLVGMSTYGLQVPHGSWLLNDAAMDAVAADFQCDVLRLCMYITNTGYAVQPGPCLERVEQGIEYATERGMYVIVDWHILNPGDPNAPDYLEAGVNEPMYEELRQAHSDYNGPQLFFAYLSEKYGSYGNVLFETANEPNGIADSESGAAEAWSRVLKPYHQSLVDVIREHDSDEYPNIVICGTDSWSQYVDSPADDPVTDPASPETAQIMYALHFYAGSHDTEPSADGTYYLGSRIDRALDHGLGVFVTEWGTTENTGDGAVNYENSDRWLDFLADRGISWCNWSLGTISKGSAAIYFHADKEPVDTDRDGIPDFNAPNKDGYSVEATGTQLTESGTYVREKIRAAHE